jgi:hypothetical protein
MSRDGVLYDNAATLEAIRREVIRGNFRGQVILHCDRGVIRDIEIVTRREPVRRDAPTERGERVYGL